MKTDLNIGRSVVSQSVINHRDVSSPAIIPYKAAKSMTSSYVNDQDERIVVVEVDTESQLADKLSELASDNNSSKTSVAGAQAADGCSIF